jgi:hypothetical protein
MSFFKTHRVWLITLAAGAVSFLTPSINAFVASHSQYGIGVATVWGIATAWAKSPNS